MADQEDLEALARGDNDLVQRDFRESDLSHQILRDRDFGGAHMQGANATGADLSNSAFMQANLLGFQAPAAIMVGIKSENTVWYKVNLSKSDLRSANFRGSHFTGTDFSNADLRGANFTNAVFNDQNLFQGSQIDYSTLFDGATILRSLSRQPVFRHYTVERGKLFRISEPVSHEHIKPNKELISAVRAAERALRDANSAIVPQVDGVVGIGHNGPPIESALTKYEVDDALAAIKIVETSASLAAPDAQLSSSIQTLKRYATKTGDWVSLKANIFADEFAKSMGKEAATVKFWVAVWLVVSGQLTQLLNIIYKSISIL